MPVIDKHIAIRRAGDRHDDRRNHKNEFCAFIKPCVSELLCVDFARNPIARQVAKRYAMRQNIIWNIVFYQGLRRQEVGVSDMHALL